MKINDVCATPKGARLNRRLRVAWKLVHGLGTFFLSPGTAPRTLAANPLFFIPIASFPVQVTGRTDTCCRSQYDGALRGTFR